MTEEEFLNMDIGDFRPDEEKHKVTVADGYLALVIADDGKGFNVKEKRKGVGLTNIINRAELYNGSLTIDTSPEMVV